MNRARALIEESVPAKLRNSGSALEVVWVGPGLACDLLIDKTRFSCPTEGFQARDMHLTNNTREKYSSDLAEIVQMFPASRRSVHNPLRETNNGHCLSHFCTL